MFVEKGQVLASSFIVFNFDAKENVVWRIQDVMA